MAVLTFTLPLHHLLTINYRRNDYDCAPPILENTAILVYSPRQHDLPILMRQVSDNSAYGCGQRGEGYDWVGLDS